MCYKPCFEVFVLAMCMTRNSSVAIINPVCPSKSIWLKIKLPQSQIQYCRTALHIYQLWQFGNSLLPGKWMIKLLRWIIFFLLMDSKRTIKVISLGKDIFHWHELLDEKKTLKAFSWMLCLINKYGNLNNYLWYWTIYTHTVYQYFITSQNFITLTMSFQLIWFWYTL